MATATSLAIVAILAAALLQPTVAQETHVVGDNMGWIVPPGGPIAYAAWASLQTFTVGDILVFNFVTGQQDVARVTREAFDRCNSTNPLWIETSGPANFTLSSVGEYYFIGTMDRRCVLGQKLAINVSESGPRVPAPPRSPVTYEVGDGLGWLVPPGGRLAYAVWAYKRTFLVGDTLVFNFVNGTQDVAMVTREAYNTCNTSSTITLLTSSPARITLNTTGEHYFTSTYPDHCALGQQLAINVTASSGTGTGIATPPSSSAPGRLPGDSSTAAGPAGALPPISSAVPVAVSPFLAAASSVAAAIFFN